MTYSELITEAFSVHQAGRFADAINRYQEILRQFPADPTAMHYFGLAMHNLGKNHHAVELMEESIRLSPDAALFNVNLAPAYRALGRYADAMRVIQRAIELQPDLWAAYNNLGNLYTDLGRLDDAISVYTSATAVKPDYIEAWCHLALVHSAKNDIETALLSIERATALQAENPLALMVLGMIECRRGRVDEAVKAARRSVEINPNDPQSLNSLGIIYRVANRGREAFESLKRAVEINPDYADAYSNLAEVLLDTSSIDSAYECAERAVRLNPALVQGHLVLCSVLQRQGQITRALERAQIALKLNPQHSGIYMTMAGAYVDSGQIQKAAAAYEKAWEYGGKMMDEAAHSVLLCLNYDPALRPDEISDAHREWGRRATAKREQRVWQPNRAKRERIRIGYISPDLRTHSVAFFVEPLLTNHDRGRFEIHAFASHQTNDAVSERFKAAVDGWHEINGFKEPQVIAKIEEQEIDILVDLAGHTAGSSLPALSAKPAPIQMNMIGYPNTTGLPAIDYRVTDNWADPEGMTEGLHVEQLIRLPRCAWCYRPPEKAPTPSRTVRRKREPIHLASFNNFAKTSDVTVRLWSTVLKQCPDVDLTLKSKCFRDNDVCHEVRARFAGQGVSPAQIILRPPDARVEDHLAKYNEIDIALDPFPYHGTTTTCEALWMGVPVVSLAGSSHVSRVGVSLLNAVGLGDLAAENETGFVRILMNLIADEKRRLELRNTLRPAMASGPLCNGHDYARAVETAYTFAWNRFVGSSNTV